MSRHRVTKSLDESSATLSKRRRPRPCSKYKSVAACTPFAMSNVSDAGGENVVVVLLLLEKVLVVVNVLDDDDNDDKDDKYRCGRMPLVVTIAQWEPKFVRWKSVLEKATVD